MAPVPIAEATRHAWLALEIALAGPSRWAQLTDAMPPAQANTFRQQAGALLDVLTLAGLEDEPATRRACWQQLRSARQADILIGITPESVLDLTAAGYPQLAVLAALRLPWDEPLLAGVVAFFLRGRPGLATDRSTTWRCLEVMARLLAERETDLVELLDRPDDATPPHRRDDDAIEKLYQLGLSRYLHGDYQQATLHFTAALKLDPTNSLLYSHRGDAFRLLCEYERAIADFDVALRLSPTNASVLVGRAIAYNLSAEYDRAIADCTAALAVERTNPVALRTRAAAYAERGEHDPALADLTEVIAHTPQDDAALYQRGVIYGKKRDYVLAIADFDHVLQMNPYHVAAYLHRGDAHRGAGDHSSAIRDYTEVLRHHPNNVLAYTSRGLAYRHKGDPDRAIADYTTALRLEPTNAAAYYSRGILLRAKGDLAHAQADLDAAIERQPESWAARYHRSKIFLALGRFEQALADLIETLRLNPKLAVAYLSRAVVYDRLGRYAEAIADGSQAIQLGGRSSPAPHLVRGVVYVHQGDYAAAIADLTQAIALDEKFTLAFHERSTAYTLQGQYDQALADCNALIALEPGQAQAYVNRSIVHHCKGDVQQALVDYAQAMQIDPKCIMAGWNQSLAERARSQATQRLADYIDGLRSELSAADTPPPPEFVIQVKPFETDRALLKPADKPSMRAQETIVDRAVTETTVETPVRAETPPARPQPRADVAGRTNRARSRKPSQAPMPEETVVRHAALTQTEIPLTPPAQAIAAEAVAEPVVASSEVVEASEPVEDAVAILLEEPLAPAAPTAVEPPAAPVPSTPTANLNAAAAAAAVLAGKPTTQPRKALRSRRVDDDEEPSFLRNWKKPMPLTAAGLAALVACYFFLPASLFGTSDQVRVFPAHGKAEFAGKPMVNATIFLNPVGTKEAQFPNPRGVVTEDGTFVLGTYGKDDGAPAGEYKVTVQWFKPAANTGKEGLAPPISILPPRYGKADLSGLTARVQEGENEIPVLKLSR